MQRRNDMKQSFFRKPVVMALMVTMLLWAGWMDSGPARAGQQHVNYRLKWLFNSSVVGDLYADVHGFFTAQGLDVTVKSGGPERDAIRELELGHAQFGVASADQVIRALAKGAPVIVIAQLFQINPLQWIYRADDPPVNKPGDLKGRTIGITYGGNDETIMRTLLAMGGLDEKNVKLFSVRYDYTPFYQGRVDIWPVYRNSQGIFIARKLRKAGEKVSFLDPAAYGVRFVANSVVTSQRMIQKHPDTVQKFARALLSGWEAALDPENRQKALETIHRFDQNTPVDLIGKQWDATRKLVKPTDDIRIGTIDIRAWQQTEKIMLTQGRIQAPVYVENCLKPCVQ